ncbi:ECF transporter S component [Homoserinimonas sp. OAct 916]|uniref:ECF transporter S component n=1 Tax=Homoserinimonas sp. OAct 916 TaxID=2211450 RepID=UPI000DBE833A|nr:ECF transporter S component [Homoserinimonas sp. OAct 916]
MVHTTKTTETESTPDVAVATGKPKRSFRWRVVDIVIAAVIGVAAGVLFWAWGIAYEGFSGPLKAALPGLQGIFGGGWLFAGVIGGLIIRKPGAALFTEVIAAAVSAAIGTSWGVTTIISGLLQGLGAELVFALFLYANWRIYVAILAGMAAGMAAGVNDLIVWYPGVTWAFRITYFVSVAVSGAVIAGALSWFAVRGIARTGALGRFAAGREVTADV